jgi:peptidoglycan/LPS O-acetylase OafA/YrhL
MMKNTPYFHLECIRGLAAVLVLVHHVRVLLFSYFESFPPELQNAVTRAYIFATGFNRGAVIVFFTLSGYLIIKKVASNLPTFGWREYLTDRLVRLYVVLIPSVLMTVLFVTVGRAIWIGDYAGGAGYNLRPEQLDITWQTILQNLCYLQTLTGPTLGDNMPLWSLAYEFWYYLLFPLMALAFQRQGVQRWINLGLLLLVFAFVSWFNKDLIMLFPCWLAGGLVVLVEKQMKGPLLSRLPSWGVGPGAVQLAGVFVLHRSLRLGLWSDYVLAFSVAVFIAEGIRVYSEPRAGVVTRTFRLLSDCSYSIYLLHNSFIGFVFYLCYAGVKIQPTTGNLLVAGCFSLLALVYCHVFYRLFEKHTWRVRKYFQRIWRPGKTTTRCAEMLPGSAS